MVGGQGEQPGILNGEIKVTEGNECLKLGAVAVNGENRAAKKEPTKESEVAASVAGES